MATLISEIETQVRINPLLETAASYWTSAELVAITIRGIKDLWRDLVNLKQEYYLTINETDVFLAANASTLSGVPNDVHKVYLIEPRDMTSNSSTGSTSFVPREYNSTAFAIARSQSAVDPQKTEFLFAVIGQGSPAGLTEVRIAPKSTSTVNLAFTYIPTLPPMVASSIVPIPGEADNALIAWTGAFARAKEREDRSPDPEWLAIYATEKQHLLNSLGLRQLQEPQYVDRVFQEYWT